MRIYRALNDVDIKLNPMANGIYNKEDITKSAERLLSIMSHNSNEKLNKNDFETIVKLIKESMYNNLRLELEETTHNEQLIIDSAIYLIHNQQYDERMERQLRYILSTINLHLRKGSTIDTKWISCSKELEKVIPYYLNQDNSNIAIIDSNINGMFDDNLLALDLSTKENIKRIREILINKDNTHTKEKFVGYNYATHSSEVVYYNHIPKERIKAVLSPFEIDLFLNGVIDSKIFDYPPITQLYIFKQIKDKLKESVNQEYADLTGLYEAMYEEGISLENIKEDTNASTHELIKCKKKMLSLLNTVDHRFTKDFPKKIKVAEEYR